MQQGQQVERRVRQRRVPPVSYAEEPESETLNSEPESEFEPGDEEDGDDEESVDDSDDDDWSAPEEPDDVLSDDDDDKDNPYVDDVRKKIMDEHLDCYTDMDGVTKYQVVKCLRFIRQVNVAALLQQIGDENYERVNATCSELEAMYDTRKLPEYGGVPRSFAKKTVVCRLYASLLSRMGRDSCDMNEVRNDGIDYIMKCVGGAVTFLLRHRADIPENLAKFFEHIKIEGGRSQHQRRLVLGASKKSWPDEDNNRLLIQVISNVEEENNPSTHICAHVPRDFELDKLFDYCKDRYKDVNARFGDRQFTVVFSPFQTLLGIHWNWTNGTTGDGTDPFVKVPAGFKLNASKTSWDKRGLFCLIENSEMFHLTEDSLYNLNRDGWDDFKKSGHDKFMEGIKDLHFPEHIELVERIPRLYADYVIRVPKYASNPNRNKKRMDKISDKVRELYEQFEYTYKKVRGKVRKKWQYLGYVESQAVLHNSFAKAELILFKRDSPSTQSVEEADDVLQRFNMISFDKIQMNRRHSTDAGGFSSDSESE